MKNKILNYFKRNTKSRSVEFFLNCETKIDTITDSCSSIGLGPTLSILTNPVRASNQTCITVPCYYGARN